jgi:hypothetical protein
MNGVCGPDVDPALPVFAGMLQQLKNKGVAVERYWRSLDRSG